MKDHASEGGNLSVFISYSRDDLEIAEKIEVVLRLQGYKTTLDQHGISPTEEWQPRLGNLIRNADTIVFVLSPSSAASEVCDWEVDEAVRLNKRIIPVVCRPLEGAQPHQELAKLEYIFIYREPESTGSSFATGVSELDEALRVDLAWLREHTRLMQRAAEWQDGQKSAARLLSGPDIAAARKWASERPSGAPAPTELHLAYIKASEVQEAAEADARARALEERERLVAETEAAQAARDAAQQRATDLAKREAEQARRTTFRTRILLAAVVVCGAVAGWFWFKSAQKAAELEVTQREMAVQLWRARIGENYSAVTDGGSAVGFLGLWETIAFMDPGLAPRLKRLGRDENIYELPYSIAIITAMLRSGDTALRASGTLCDQLASHPRDPMRIAPGVTFEEMEADRAVKACEEAAAKDPDNARLIYLKARARTAVAERAERRGNKADATVIYNRVIEDLKAAAQKGYPIAFNNLLLAYELGEGVEKDPERQSQYLTERLNRYLECCWAIAVQYLLQELPENELYRAYSMLEAVTPWAAALGSKEAADLIDSLEEQGHLFEVERLPPAKFTDPPPWFRGEAAEETASDG